jgi:dethiobiotin synthetase
LTPVERHCGRPAPIRDSMTRGLFVTGTDTGIGKTWATVGILTALREQGIVAVGMKPVASGCARTPDGLRSEDAELLLQHSSLSLPYHWVNPYALEPPIAPHIAAEEAGRRIELEVILSAYGRLAATADYVVVEGVGGWKAPLNANETVADLAAALQFPMVLVAGIRLGCLSHALLTVESIAHAGLPLAGWIANRIDPACERIEANIQALANRIPAPLLGIVPHMAKLDAAAIAGALDLDVLASSSRFGKA